MKKTLAALLILALSSPAWGHPSVRITTSGGGGSSSNSFETHDAPNGTDPVASSATDTLTWANTSPIVITGDSATNTITISCPTCATAVSLWSTGSYSQTWSDGNSGKVGVTATDADEAILAAGFTWGNGSLYIEDQLGVNGDAYFDGDIYLDAVTPAQFTCTDCIQMPAETTGDYAAGITAGDGLTTPTAAGENTTWVLHTASQEAGFLEDGGAVSLTCGASNQGKMQVMDDGTIEYCDGATTSVLQTIDPAATGLWTDGGTYTYPADTTERISIGTASPTSGGQLVVEGQASATIPALAVRQGSGSTTAPIQVFNSAGSTVFSVLNGTGDASILDSAQFIGGGVDGTGAVDLDYGSADITDHTFTTDGTGDGEIVLPNESIGPDEVMATGKTDEYLLTYEATGDTWEWLDPSTVGTTDHGALSGLTDDDHARYLDTTADDTFSDSTGDWNINADTSNGTDTKTVVISGGGGTGFSAGRGAAIEINGADVTSENGDINILGADTTASEIFIQTNTTDDTGTITLIATSTGADPQIKVDPSNDTVEFTNADLEGATTGAEDTWAFHMSTSDASDNDQVVITGGGSDSPDAARGAYMLLAGNQHSPNAGDVIIHSGSDSSASAIELKTNGGAGGYILLDNDDGSIDQNFRIGTGEFRFEAVGGTGNYSVELYDGIDLVMHGSTSGFIDHEVPAIVTSHTLIWPSAQGGADTYLKNDGAGNLSWATASGSTPPKEFFWDAASMYCVESANCMASGVRNGTTVDTIVLLADDTTDEFVNLKLWVPDDLDTSGTIEFAAYVEPVSHAANDVILALEHLAVTTGESVDQAYTTETSGATTMSASANIQTEVVWTETVSTAGWAAGDTVYMRLSRDANNASDTLSGDLRVLSLRIKVPRS